MMPQREIRMALTNERHYVFGSRGIRDVSYADIAFSRKSVIDIRFCFPPSLSLCLICLRGRLLYVWFVGFSLFGILVSLVFGRRFGLGGATRLQQNLGFAVLKPRVVPFSW